MKKLLWLSVLVTGAALGAPALMTKTSVTKLPVCKLLGCKEVKRYAATDTIMGKYVHAQYTTSRGYDLQADYSLSGELTGVDISLRRNPLDENDKAAILQLVENLTGSKYTKSVLEKCFTEASSKAKLDDFFSGQNFMAGGQTPIGAPWYVGCWTFVKPYDVINRVYITFAFR